MSLLDLTSLANAKAWMGLTTTVSDSALQRLISAKSQSIANYIQRGSIISQTYNDYYDGLGIGGKQSLILRKWPVTSIASVTINGQIIPQSPAFANSSAPSGNTAGWSANLANAASPMPDAPPGKPCKIELTGYEFCPGNKNVQVIYTAGYLVSGEQVSLGSLSGLTYQVQAPLGSWNGDSGVINTSTNTALTPISGGTPAAGQYSVASGLYTFSQADKTSNLQVGTSYSYIPYDLEQACIDMVNESWAQKTRPGLKSKALASQETMTWDMTAAGLPSYIAVALANYRNMGAF